MYVSSIVGANKDFAIGKGQTMYGTLTFLQNGSPYSLTGITPSFRIYIPGQATAVLTLTSGDGLTVGENTIVFNKLISLDSRLYRYELHFLFPDDTEAIMMDGGFWVRKSGVTSNAETTVNVTQNTVSITVNVSLAGEDGDTRIYSSYFTIPDGENSVTHADLNGITEILACLIEEGGSYKPVTGTPEGREVKYTNGAGDGTIEFDPEIEFGSGTQVHLIYKKATT